MNTRQETAEQVCNYSVVGCWYCTVLPEGVSSKLFAWALVGCFTGMSLAASNVVLKVSPRSNTAEAAERKPARLLLRCGARYSAHVAHCNSCLASAEASRSHYELYVPVTCITYAYNVYVHVPVPGRQLGGARLSQHAGLR